MGLLEHLHCSVSDDDTEDKLQQLNCCVKCHPVVITYGFLTKIWELFLNSDLFLTLASLYKKWIEVWSCPVAQENLFGFCACWMITYMFCIMQHGSSDWHTLVIVYHTNYFLVWSCWCHEKFKVFLFYRLQRNILWQHMEMDTLSTDILASDIIAAWKKILWTWWMMIKGTRNWL